MHELRERRARGDARGAAINLIANLREEVLLDPNGKTGDVTARSVP
jgi:hypothetical protein